MRAFEFLDHTADALVRARGDSLAELLVACMYSSLSKPVIFCSMIWVTVFSTVSAEAPG